MATTQLSPLALPGQPYGSFAGKSFVTLGVVSLFRVGEVWNTGMVFVGQGSVIEDLLRLEATSPERVIVNIPTGEIDNLQDIPHGLGREPQGVRIINAILASAGEVTWYRLDGDKAWTEREVSIRFRFDDAEVLLEIF